MSYILDALRKADAERQQGQVPGLNAAAASAGAADVRGAAVWPWVVGALLLALLAAAAWAWWPRPAAVPAAAVVPAPVAPATPAPAAPPPAPALPIVVSAAPPAPAPASALAVATPPPAAPAPLAAKPVQPLTRTVALAALPPDERRQLPPLVPGGSVWSDSAASRFVILDGQVLREGESLAPGVVLERIERKAAVLRWKEQRVEVPL